MRNPRIPLHVDIPDLHCDNPDCGKEHKYDVVMGWGGVVLMDERGFPHEVLGASCDVDCLNQWLTSPDSKNFLGILTQKAECRYCERLKELPGDEFGGWACELHLQEDSCSKFELGKCYDGHDPREEGCAP